jgi:TRAP-type mannitol/chloroaromatic compound transport system permease small subunit
MEPQSQDAISKNESSVTKLTSSSQAILHRLLIAIEKMTTVIGHSAAWLLLMMVLLQSLVVVLRYGFEIGSIALQESVSYLHACCFMLGAAYTLKVDQHVRVDIIYRNLSFRKRAWVNLVGAVLFLIPLMLLIIWSSVGYVSQAWQVQETSAEPGGLAFVYLLKTLIPLFALTLLCQAAAEIIKSLLIILHSPDEAK